ncbi:MAG TPA: Na+/H+ antiporter subunit E [Thermoanaerobaculia bacterium]|nr:Na+/H+ antiporter subunit E [Thermoanaerobaculia bacterium]
MSASSGFLSNLVLAVFWALASGRVTVGTLVVGFVAGFATIFVTQRATGAEAYTYKAWRAVILLLVFIRELIEANLRLAHDVLTPTHHMRPAIVAIPLDARTDFEITLLANLITLTPGTLTLHVADDRSVLYIHSVYTPDADELRRSVKEGLERRILELTR